LLEKIFGVDKDVPLGYEDYQDFDVDFYALACMANFSSCQFLNIAGLAQFSELSPLPCFRTCRISMIVLGKHICRLSTLFFRHSFAYTATTDFIISE